MGERAAKAQYESPKPSSSWTDSISSGFKKVGGALSPKKPAAESKIEDDAVSLQGKGKPGPNLHVQMARLHEGNNKPADAEQQYKLALELDRDYLPALMGYAQLKERMEKPEDAIRLYQRAAKGHPKDASVFNNMGLCFARAKRLNEAAVAMGRAAELDPRNALYRNNLATLLVDQGRDREAFEQLGAVHDAAATYYNMGYLLNKKGRIADALQQFTLALQADPSMVPARRWVEFLQPKVAQSRLPKPMDGAVKVISSTPTTPQDPASRQRPAAEQTPAVEEPTLPSEPSIASRRPATPATSPIVIVESEPAPFLESAPLPPPAPRRLPPTNVREPAVVTDGPSGSSSYYGRHSTTPAAPLPPATASRPGAVYPAPVQ